MSAIMADAVPTTIPATWAVADYIAMLRQHLPALARQYHITSLGVFGSYVRNEQTPQSDLDVLVEFDDLPGLFTYVEIQEVLTELLGVPVDLVHRSDLKPYMSDTILGEVILVSLTLLRFMVFYGNVWLFMTPNYTINPLDKQRATCYNVIVKVSRYTFFR